MGIFDKLKSSAIDTVMSAAGSIGNRAETFTFAALPESLAELRALPGDLYLRGAAREPRRAAGAPGGGA